MSGGRIVHFLQPGGAAVAAEVNHVDVEAALGKVGGERTAGDIQIKGGERGDTGAMEKKDGRLCGRGS